jgi:hypothetical protein
LSLGVIFSDSAVKERMSAKRMAMSERTWSPSASSAMLFFDRQRRNSLGMKRAEMSSVVSH